MWSGQWPGLEPAGLGRAWASTMIIVLRAGPGHTFCGPGLIIQFAGQTRAGSAQLLRPGHGLGLKSYLRAGPGPKFQARAGP